MAGAGPGPCKGGDGVAAGGDGAAARGDGAADAGEDGVVLHPSESPRANPATPGDEESERLKHLNDYQTMLHPPESAQGTPATPSEVESRRLKHLNDPQTQDQEELLRVIVSELGFDSSRPVVACVTYKALLHWRSFEAERTSVFDRIIQTI
ncbi:unnamed protein product [Closterium sp. NIES-65]|nr:unnamed protein product [Closterium sp. NIES-65]